MALCFEALEGAKVGVDHNTHLVGGLIRDEFGQVLGKALFHLLCGGPALRWKSVLCKHGCYPMCLFD